MQSVEDQDLLGTSNTWDSHYARVIFLLTKLFRGFSTEKEKLCEYFWEMHTYRLPASYLQREDRWMQISSSSSGSR